MDRDQLNEYRNYAWNYFSVHAAQRMSVFQFFITLATAILGGAVIIASSVEDRQWSALLFLALPFLSFIFWRLDHRTSSLVKNAEDALKYIDSVVVSELGGKLPEELALFARDDTKIGIKAANKPFRGHFSYSRSFRYVFVAVSLLGLLGASIVLIDKFWKASISVVDCHTCTFREQLVSEMTGKRIKNITVLLNLEPAQVALPAESPDNKELTDDAR